MAAKRSFRRVAAAAMMGAASVFSSFPEADAHWATPRGVRAQAIADADADAPASGSGIDVRFTMDDRGVTPQPAPRRWRRVRRWLRRG